MAADEKTKALAREHYLRNNAWMMGYEPDTEDVAWAEGVQKAQAGGIVEGTVVKEAEATTPAPGGALVPAPLPKLPVQPAGLPTVEPTVMDAGQVLKRLEMMMVIRQAIKAQLRNRVHYGTQPGVSNPFLWQAGASLIAYCYNVAPSPNWHKRVDWFDYTDPKTGDTQRHLTCTTRVDLVSRNTGAIVYSGPERSATSLESRWRVRLKERSKRYKDRATGKYKDSQYKLAAEPIEVLQDLVERQSCKRSLVDAVRLFSGMDDEFTVEGDVEREDDTQDGESEAPKPEAGKGKAPAAATEGKPTTEQYEELSTLLAAKQSTLSREAEARKWTLPLTQKQMAGLLQSLKAKK